ncbi:hypothetical protein C2845_PM01G28070 [Panicum miliaceum]|uniref:X8 domain-containing protein n=1 Tax=Panicum miliaceum TaxID=4540 RepID=A0A3L6TRK4_PANMI|nr:hypothetical protein C2845_PM01G28070 [Panicum miliaceum]
MNKPTDDVLKQALDWACSPGGADCSMIQPNKSWYLPNTVRYHASMPSTTTGKSSRNMGGTDAYVPENSTIPAVRSPPNCRHGKNRTGAPSSAAVWTRWYRDAVCQTCQNYPSPKLQEADQ